MGVVMVGLDVCCCGYPRSQQDMGNDKEEGRTVTEPPHHSLPRRHPPWTTSYRNPPYHLQNYKEKKLE
jgi:hypothetical protein